MSSRFDDLKRLADMRHSGDINQEEYESLKAELLDSEPYNDSSLPTDGPVAGYEVVSRSPGWYRDPEGRPHAQRYWDGQRWGEKTRLDPSTKLHRLGDPPRLRGKEEATTGMGVVSGTIVFLVAVFIFLLAQCTGGSEDKQPSSGSSRTVEAFTICQMFVEDRLVAPATANFGGAPSQATTRLGANRYQVDAYVDSENNFGAQIRTEYSCTVSYNSGGDSWTLESLTTDP